MSLLWGCSPSAGIEQDSGNTDNVLDDVNSESITENPYSQSETPLGFTADTQGLRVESTGWNGGGSVSWNNQIESDGAVEITLDWISQNTGSLSGTETKSAFSINLGEIGLSGDLSQEMLKMGVYIPRNLAGLITVKLAVRNGTDWDWLDKSFVTASAMADSWQIFSWDLSGEIETSVNQVNGLTLEISDRSGDSRNLTADPVLYLDFISWGDNQDNSGSGMQPIILGTSDVSAYVLSGTNPSVKAQSLYSNLALLEENFLFGQANARNISAAVSGAKNSVGTQSDVKDVVGSHPAFIESDFMWYYDDPIFTSNDIAFLQDHYDEGGIVGYAWHFRDPQGEFYDSDYKGYSHDNSDLLNDIVNDLNGRQDWFYQQIDDYALPALNTLKQAGIPVIIRPFHEMNGGWFWWGNKPAADYIALYKMFADYLRVTKGLDNLILAWSPNVSFDTTAKGYYPGDDYVDIVGLDYYEPTAAALAAELEKVVAFSSGHNKIAALTETGYRAGGYGDLTANPDFWTADIQLGIDNSNNTRQVAYVMSWYNAKWGSDNINVYTPYEGMGNSAALESFSQFRGAPEVGFLDELPDMYE